jgi:hypothetical protein
MSEVLGAEGLLYPTFGTLDGSAQGGDAQIALCSMTFAAVRAGAYAYVLQAGSVRGCFGLVCCMCVFDCVCLTL